MATSLHQRVVDEVGRPIVDGTTTPGTVMLADDIERRLGVSRSVVREAVRVLQSMGLVASIKHIGIRVQPSARWNWYNGQLIRWRLDGADRGAQLRSITEVGCAAEPIAAELAAMHCPPEIADELLHIAEELRQMHESRDLSAYIERDAAFHRLMLHASGNEMFARLDDALTIVLLDPAALTLMPTHTENVVHWHVDAAKAIRAHNPGKARKSVELIMRRRLAELEPIWADAPRRFLPTATASLV